MANTNFTPVVLLALRACLIRPFSVHRVMFLNQVIFECGVTFCDHCSTHIESSIEHQSSKVTCNFAFIDAFFKPLKITQFIYKFPFGEIILLIDLYFYDCETELFSKNQVYRIMSGAVHPNHHAIKYGVEKSN